MFKLLKADLYKVIKSKLLIIAIIIAAAFPLLFALLCVGINALDAMEAELSGVNTGTVANAVFGVKLSFSFASIFLIILPIFSGIFICNDIASGSQRNKIIIGKSRPNIYFSHLIVTLLFTISITTVYIISTLIFSNIILPKADFNADVVLDLFLACLDTLLMFIFVSAVVLWVSMSTQSVPLTILSAIAGGLMLPYITMALGLFEPNMPEGAVYWLSIIPTYSTAGGFASLIEIPEDAATYDPWPQIIGSISYIGFGVLFVLLGLHNFKKKDLK